MSNNNCNKLNRSVVYSGRGGRGAYPMVAAAGSVAPGYGGVSKVSRATGVSRRAITEGVKELQSPLPRVRVARGLRVRREGGGRKQVLEKDPALVRELVKFQHSSGPSLRDGYANRKLDASAQELFTKSKGLTPSFWRGTKNLIEFSVSRCG